MFHLIRKLALVMFSVAQRFYLGTPASPYEAILFGYIKAIVAQLFFREVKRGTV
jgi:hypothetical protein